jgi:hypothetical protein
MLSFLRRRALKKLARGLPPNPKRRFDPVAVLDGDLVEAARRFAREANDHGASGTWWRVWREIVATHERETEHPFLREAVASLSAEQKRWFSVWSLRKGDAAEGIDAYRAFLAKPSQWGPFEADNLLFLEALVARGRLDEALAEVDRLDGEGLDAPGEQVRVALALLDAGRAPEALARLAPVRARYQDDGRVWAVTALLHGAAGVPLEARRAAAEAAKRGLHDDALRERLTATVLSAEAWGAEVRRHAYAPDDLAEQQQAWRDDPGADLVPDPTGPHTFGGDPWSLPACRGCGHPIHAWFTLDLASIPSLAARLPGWRFLPLLGCVDCMVWMGRHDYALDPVDRRVELVNVALSTSRYGAANATTPAAPGQRAALRQRSLPGEEDDPPDRPQVGGVPAWTQDAQRVWCPECRREMTFVAAMANPEGFAPAIAVNNESGFQYHFACAPCRRLSVIAQWT